MTSLPRIQWKHYALIALVVLTVGGLFTLMQQPLGQVFATYTHKATSSSYKVLFDDAHAETAGNADWVISSSRPDPLKENPNPQAETDWTGGLSSWGVALQKTGRYSLMTNTSTITYGNSSNPLDLSTFNAFILPEPNTLFTASEKTAILTFVHNGGGLFMIADHTGSDRNNDGYDSLQIFNDLMSNSGVGNDPFGITFDAARIARDYPSVDTPNPDPILQGPFGIGTTSLINQGTTETIHPTDNPNVVGVVYTTGSSNTGTTGVFIARSTYGTGHVVAVGDSSAIDDGTCESGHKCYNGWGDSGAQNSTLFLNGTEWLASSGTNSGTPIPTVTTTATTIVSATTTMSVTATSVPASPTPTPTQTASPTPTSTVTTSCDFYDWWLCF
ncbi:MAG: hypothetical protein NVS2B2_06460 [Ktedonobacteraceae bacterium]